MNLLPGLYVGALAALLGWALKRWFDPIPGRVWAAFGILLALYFAPVLVGGEIFFPGEILRRSPGFSRLDLSPAEINPVQWDVVHQITPWQAAVRRCLAAGEWPLWNPFAGGGEPLLANPQSQALKPLVVLAYPFPLPVALGVTAALTVLLALVFTYLLLARLGISSRPALAAAIAYGGGGFLLRWLGWPLSTLAAVLPVLLYAIALGADRGSRQDYLLLAAALATALTGGHPETILYVLALSGAFALARLSAVPRQRRRRHLLASTLAAAVALGVTAPAWLPTARYLPQTERHLTLGWRLDQWRGVGFLGRWRTAEERAERLEHIDRLLASTAAPHAFGSSRFGAYWGAQTSNDAAGFVGTAALLAALLAAAGTGSGRRFPGERLVLAAGGLSLLVLAQVPGLQPLLARLPLFNQTVDGHRALSIVAFAVSFLAACAWERWRRGELARGRLLLSAAALAALVTWAYLGHPPPEGELPLDGLRRGSLALQLGALAGAVTLLARPPRGRGREWGLVALVLIETAFFHQPLYPPAPRELFYPQLPQLSFVQQQLGHYRAAAVGGALGPNVAGIYGIPELRRSNPAGPALQPKVLQPLCIDGRAFSCRLRPVDHPLLDLFAVRFAVTHPDARLPPPFRKVFQHPAGRVFERPDPLPVLFLPEAAEPRSVTHPVHWLSWLHDAERDFGIRSGVETAALAARAWRATATGPSALQQLTERSPAHWYARAWLYEPRLLATSLYQDGGWHLVTGGRRRETIRTNGFFAGAWLAAGDYDLHLLYRPPGFFGGVLLAALALAVAMAWWGAPAVSPARLPFEEPAAPRDHPTAGGSP